MDLLELHVIVALAVLTGSSAIAAPRFAGQVWLGQEYDDGTGGSLNLYADIGLVSDGNELSSQLSALLLGREIFSNRNDTEMLVSQANLARSWQSIDIKVGRQYVFWGQIPFFGPVDVISGYRFAQLEEPVFDDRIATDAINARYYADESKELQIYLGYFDGDDDVIALPETINGRPVRKAAERVKNNLEAGLRYSVYLERAADVNVSLFNGSSRFPARNFVLEGDTYQQELIYSPLTMLAVDGSFAYRDSAINWQLAYKRSSDRAGDDPFIQNDTAQVALGVNTAFGSNGRLQFDAVFTQLLDYDVETERTLLEGALGFAPEDVAPETSAYLSARYAWEFEPWRFSAKVEYEDDSNRTADRYLLAYDDDNGFTWTLLRADSLRTRRRYWSVSWSVRW
ncbi:MAG: hypothetical protein ACR2RB_03985 [Gammaproteobacteria bacterium]